MALDNLKDLSIQWIVGGLLLTCLLGFAIQFTYFNNPIGLNDGSANDVFADSYANSSSLLDQSSTKSDELLNITANTNPEVSDLGSRDSVAAAFSAKGSSTEFFDSAKNLAGWVFSGAIGKMLLVVIGGLIGMLSFFFIWQYIRTGR